MDWLYGSAFNSSSFFVKGIIKKINYSFYENYPSKVQGKYIKIAIPITKQEMSELLNIRRETISRMLSSLKEENICECAYKEIIVS